MTVPQASSDPLPSQTQAGICIPLLSLWSEQSLGCGEFLDLLPLIPWLRSVGFSVLQLLPVNDTGSVSSPYTLCSSCALHPIYLRLSALPFLDRVPQLLASLQTWQKSSSHWVDYEQVLAKKLSWFQLYCQETRSLWREHPGLQTFTADQSGWLEAYACYKALKAHYQERPWWEWPHDAPELEQDLFDQTILQYLLWEQLHQVHTVAQQQNLQIFGDLPILVGRDSADAWTHPTLFQFDFEAGAPPDDYAPEGQNWSFPTYDWAVHKGSEFSWWKQRLHYAESFYDLYRIDHVLGFFRLWTIPLGLPALGGTFVPADEKAWLPQGRAILEMLQKSSPMRPMAEDLGTVPNGVRETLAELGIPGMKVIRWEHTPKAFKPLEEYPALSICSYSTHDSSLLGTWWHEHPQEARLFCRSRNHPYMETLSPEDRRWLLLESFRSGSHWVIHLIQEYLSAIPSLMPEALADIRINSPGIVSVKNWTQRLPCSVEQITASTELRQLLSACQEIAQSKIV